MLGYLVVFAVMTSLMLYLYWLAKNSAWWKNAGSGASVSRRYFEIFENSSDAIFVVEVLGTGRFRFESLNPVAIQAFDPRGDGLEGRRFDELSRRTINHSRNHLLPDLSLYLVQAVETGMPASYEHTFCIAQGADKKVYDFQLVPMADDGGITHVLCFARDITARKLYEQELSKRAALEERLSGFASSAPGFFYSFRHGMDGSNRMPFASEGIHELFGLRPEDVAQSIAPLNLLTHLDDMSRMFAAIAHSAADLSPMTVEFRTQHPDKGEIWIESRATPVAQPDASIIWHGFMHDITGRKRMDEALRRNRENLAEAQRLGQMGSWVLDLASGALTWSDEIYRIFEIAPGMIDASHETIRNTIHPDDREKAKRAHTESLGHRLPFIIDYRLLFPDGRVKYARESCETYYAEDGTPIQMHGTVQDITSLKVTEQQLKDTQDKLRELVISREFLREDERKRIAWEMHEELGQLLAVMKMRIGAMRMQPPENVSARADESDAVIELIDQSIRMVREIVSELHPTALLHGAVVALEWLVAEFNRHSGMECKLVIDQADGECVSDELSTLVFRVAQEALENAVRHEGVSRVTISWSSRPEGCSLTVEHDGEDGDEYLLGGRSLSYFGMQERVSAFGGEMRVFSTLGRGMVMEASFSGHSCVSSISSV